MNYDELKRNIADVVKPNGNQEITGQIMQDALFALIENLGEGWQFGGAVRPSDVPALGADVRAFYLAVEKGVYAEFGGVEVTELSAIVYGDGWGVLPLGVAFGVDTEAEIGALSERVKALEADGSVTTSRIADGAVTTPKIANEAVTDINGPSMIIAGPGSGKTRCLIARTIYMIKNGIKPENILLFTFTRKAANEIIERLEAELGNLSKNITVGTYHSIANKILRKYSSYSNLDSNYSI